MLVVVTVYLMYNNYCEATPKLYRLNSERS